MPLSASDRQRLASAIPDSPAFPPHPEAQALLAFLVDPALPWTTPGLVEIQRTSDDHLVGETTTGDRAYLGRASRVLALLRTLRDAGTLTTTDYAALVQTMDHWRTDAR
jgi:hypothetical protein